MHFIDFFCIDVDWYSIFILIAVQIPAVSDFKISIEQTEKNSMVKTKDEIYIFHLLGYLMDGP